MVNTLHTTILCAILTVQNGATPPCTVDQLHNLWLMGATQEPVVPMKKTDTHTTEGRKNGQCNTVGIQELMNICLKSLRQNNPVLQGGAVMNPQVYFYVMCTK